MIRHASAGPNSGVHRGLRAGSRRFSGMRTSSALAQMTPRGRIGTGGPGGLRSDLTFGLGARRQASRIPEAYR